MLLMVLLQNVFITLQNDICIHFMLVQYQPIGCLPWAPVRSALQCWNLSQWLPCCYAKKFIFCQSSSSNFMVWGSENIARSTKIRAVHVLPAPRDIYLRGVRVQYGSAGDVEQHQLSKVGNKFTDSTSPELTRELNVVTTQITPLFNRSNVDKQLQPNFPQNELSLALDKIH